MGGRGVLARIGVAAGLVVGSTVAVTAIGVPTAMAVDDPSEVHVLDISTLDQTFEMEDGNTGTFGAIGAHTTGQTVFGSTWRNAYVEPDVPSGTPMWTEVVSPTGSDVAFSVTLARPVERVRLHLFGLDASSVTVPLTAPDQTITKVAGNAELEVVPFAGGVFVNGTTQPQIGTAAGCAGADVSSAGGCGTLEIAVPPGHTFDTIGWVAFRGASDDSWAYTLSYPGVPADLRIAKTVSPQVVEPGGTLTWTVTVTNEGPNPSSGHTVYDAVPSSVTNLAAPTPGCTVAGGLVTCAGGPLAVGETATYTITGTAPTAPGDVPNQAVVDGADLDPNSLNDLATALASVAPGVCTARALGVLDRSVGVANPAAIPCSTKDGTILGTSVVPFGPIPLLPLLGAAVKVTGLQARTTRTGSTASAESHLASVVIGVPMLGVSVSATGVQSAVSLTRTSCAAPTTGSSLSRIATLQVNGATIPVGPAPITIPLLLGSLKINDSFVQDGIITRRALFLDLPGTVLDVVVGESTAGLTCPAGPAA